MDASMARKALIEKACKIIMDEVEETIEGFRSLKQPQISDDYEDIHLRLVATGTIDSELSHLYTKALDIRREVEVSKLTARDRLNDAKMEAVQKPTFRTPNTYVTGEETSAKLRSLTFEAHYEYSIWEKLSKEVDFLVDTIRVYQLDVGRHRRDADLRFKIISMGF